MSDKKQSKSGGRGRPPTRPAATRPALAFKAQLDQAAAALRKGDQQAAIAALSPVIDETQRTGTPVPRSAFYDLAVLLFQARRYTEAEARARLGLQRFPNDFGLANLLGVVLKNLSRHDEALAVLDAAAKLDPDSLSPYINRGNIHQARRDGAKAAAEFAHAVQKDPDNPEYHRLLGGALRQQGLVKQALAAFETARRRSP